MKLFDLGKRIFNPMKKRYFIIPGYNLFHTITHTMFKKIGCNIEIPTANNQGNLPKIQNLKKKDRVGLDFLNQNLRIAIITPINFLK